MNLLLVFIAIGAASGVHSACWGAYKDSLFEEFRFQKFIRSIIVGSLLAVFFFYSFRRIVHINLGVAFALIVALERGVTEIYKAFIRKEDQSIYRIPSSFHVLGKVLTNRIQKGMIFLLLALVLFGLFFWANSFPIQGNLLVGGLTWGLFGGLITASGGAWKDAPIEGFSILTYFRSPIISTLFGIVFSLLVTPPLFILLASIGAERMCVECYKAFIRNKVPGKFRQIQPVHIDWMYKRSIILVPYVLTWVLFVVLFMVPSIKPLD